MHKGFPAGAAVIGARRIALVALCQVRQFLDRMLTERWWIVLRPLRLEFTRLSVRRAPTYQPFQCADNEERDPDATGHFHCRDVCIHRAPHSHEVVGPRISLDKGRTRLGIPLADDVQWGQPDGWEEG